MELADMPGSNSGALERGVPVQIRGGLSDSTKEERKLNLKVEKLRHVKQELN